MGEFDEFDEAGFVQHFKHASVRLSNRSLLRTCLPPPQFILAQTSTKVVIEHENQNPPEPTSCVAPGEVVSTRGSVVCKRQPTIPPFSRRLVPHTHIASPMNKDQVGRDCSVRDLTHDEGTPEGLSD